MASINMTRRGFAAATASLAVATAASPAFAAATPRLYGDGIHDDTEALEHLLNGGAVMAVSPHITAEADAGSVRLLNAKFRTRRPLRMVSGLHLYAANCTFIVAGGPAMPYPILADSTHFA